MPIRARLTSASPEAFSLRCFMLHMHPWLTTTSEYWCGKEGQPSCQHQQESADSKWLDDREEVRERERRPGNNLLRLQTRMTDMGEEKEVHVEICHVEEDSHWKNSISDPEATTAGTRPPMPREKGATKKRRKEVKVMTRVMRVAQQRWTTAATTTSVAILPRAAAIGCHQ